MGAVLLCAVYNLLFQAMGVKSSMQHSTKYQLKIYVRRVFRSQLDCHRVAAGGCLLRLKRSLLSLTRAHTGLFISQRRNLPIQSPRTHTRIIFSAASLVNHNKSRIWKSLSPTDKTRRTARDIKMLETSISASL